MAYELLDHTGDLGIEVRAPGREALFAEAARAMFEIVAHVPDPRPEGTEDFAVPPDASADALRDFLAELLYRFGVERKVYVGFTPRSGTVAAAWQPYDPSRHPLRTELKAVTWHRLEVREEKPGWFARVIFDV